MKQVFHTSEQECIFIYQKFYQQGLEMPVTEFQEVCSPSLLNLTNKCILTDNSISESTLISSLYRPEK